MRTKFSRRLNALNQSIDRKLERIEIRAADATAASKTDSNQRTGKPSVLQQETAIKAPCMLQKKTAPESDMSPSVLTKSAVSLDAKPSLSSRSYTKIWSRQGIEPDFSSSLSSSSEAVLTCYRLTEGRLGYEEESTSEFQKKMIHERCMSDAKIVVKMGDLKTATDDDLIQTSGMSDCSSIVLLTDFNLKNKTYGKRSLIHIPGSSFDSLDKPHEMADKLHGLAKASSGRPLMILVSGRISSNYLTEQTFIWTELRSEDGTVRQPVRELLALCDMNILPLTVEITVWPNGSLMTKHDYRSRDSWSQPPAPWWS